MRDLNEGANDSSVSSRPNTILESTTFQLSLLMTVASPLGLGATGQRVESPATVTGVGFDPDRSIRAKTPPTSNSIPNVVSTRALFRKIDSLSHFDPKRKWKMSRRTHSTPP